MRKSKGILEEDSFEIIDGYPYLYLNYDDKDNGQIDYERLMKD